ncbi:Histidine kinase-, DNA gyrase B-, and HSP90-like ATPase [Streptomyces sp. Ag82_O1-12]|uniref:sensor histidine kinase n=1 Tax=unclassified Streptomyces TaxID=2593676 RepID=UPI000BDB4F94|nr:MULTISPECIES: ATP-binding protein [unclassified Streptomyces]SMQ21169.1 Histidine kinase-, DNA gyrase B-, and HSP90-like ATPase [Streptomyces sp. Ag82_O1-12]SOD49764.1 Histidine kinase-, DNA gyrase B-, and HSP90-like ATPase [Streptomyces sp. Ag82_G6-1]
MELATPPPAARAPVAWYSWWLMPLGLGGGTVAATFMSSERITVAVAGIAATAAGSVCVRLLLRTRAQLLRAEGSFRTTQAEHNQQWQQHVAGLERKFAVDRAGLESQLNEQNATYERRLADQSATYETQLADRSRAYEERLTEQATSYEAQLADQAAVWQEQLSHQLAAVTRLADEQLPDAMEKLRSGDAIDDLLPTVNQCAKVSSELQAELRKLLRTSLIGLEAEFDRSTSAEQAVISIGNRIHVLTSKLRGRLHEMQGEHGRLPAVARGLMELDQELGPADSLAASIGVLGGSDRPGRQWQEPQRLLSVVRGGIGRIKDFHRIQVRHLPELGVDGGLVDHLTLILAHLLDNAARYSPPTEPVLISGKEVPNGVGIEIQDSGKGLSEEKKREAEHALAGTAPGAGLGGITEDASIGLRVVGALARRYGIRVTFADSPWLGTSVVIVVPHKYFSPLPTSATAPAAPAPQARTATAAPARETATVPEPRAAQAETGETTPGGLPRRRSKRNETEAPRPSERTDRGTVAAVPPDASFSGLAAFATAGRDAAEASEAAGDRDILAGREFTEHRTEESD